MQSDTGTMAQKLSPLAPILDIHSVPLDNIELIAAQVGRGVGEIDISFVKSFNEAWSKFMHENGIFIGTHEQKISALQKVAIKLKKSKDDIKSELKKQTLFVRKNRDEMELIYKHRRNEALTSNVAMDKKQKEMEGRIEEITNIMRRKLYWVHFVKELDQIMPNNVFIRREDTNGKIISLFGERAIGLSSIYNNVDRKKVDSNVLLQRATKVENALLMIHLQQLKVEVQRYKTIVGIQRDIGMVLEKVQS
jgi:hypothetical protein